MLLLVVLAVTPRIVAAIRGHLVIGPRCRCILVGAIASLLIVATPIRFVGFPGHGIHRAG
jgi:hypothetical protein